MRERRGGTARVGDLLDPALRAMHVRGHVREAQLREVFADVVGEAVAPLCRAVSLDRGVLLVATVHSALAHQLQLEAPRLIAILNHRIASDAVRRLRFTTMDMAAFHDTH